MASTINATTTSGVQVSGDNSGVLQLQTNTGTTAITIDTSQNVGINTTSPAATLDINKASATFRIRDASGGNDFTVKTIAGPVSLVGSVANTATAFMTNDTERMRIDTSGNVGIGTASPAAKLGIVAAGDGTFNSQVVIAPVSGANPAKITFNPSVSSAIAGLSDGSVAFYGNGANTERMRIDTSGNVGIGTSSPAYKLDVNGQYAIVGASGAEGAYLTRNSSGVLQWKIGNSGGALQFLDFVAGAERARIDSSGNLLVGKTSSDLSTAGFGVDVRSGVLNGVSIIKNDTSWGTALYIRRNATASTGAAIEFSNNGTTVGTVTINASTTSYNTSSDYRLKENIAPMTGALSVVSQLKPCTYTWKADGSDGQGFIAHELQTVVPDCVTGEKDAVDADGNPVYQGIDTSFLVATLTAAIQEQQALITQLTERISALENK